MNEPAPLIICNAPNGARRTAADHPALPITPAALANTAAAIVEAGAAMMHLHVRAADGSHSLDVDAYRAALAAIRRCTGDTLVLQVTTESAGVYASAEQMAMVRALRPEAVSLALRELCPDPSAENVFAEFLHWLRRESISAQYILYSAQEVARFTALCQRGLVPDDRPAVLLVLGRYDEPATSRADALLPLLAGLDLEAVVWSVCAFGSAELACSLTAAGLGGHCRVGFENNLQLADGSTAADNAALVRQLAQSATLLGRTPADAATARQLLGMPG